ncbi:Multiphosphoryl transfer protein [Vibrio stylophorae]|uniref:Multiphosphoryl transfer protein n=1 Tax=Vibrio stylophorae TaxID=659351 RepID=A0ABM8ZXP9_9VIBR|nr:fused PTS fructose transporter subunit IIA/HPr protein [Vibrio stylophorae]CAH0535546.1 Multiphosphoryl transfer protein [Vibrio stylophorae]
MLSLTAQDIQLQQVAEDKQSAIDALAARLTERGFVESGYVAGMQARELQNSTYLGNGIAIPHGTTDTRDLVKTTGVTIAHYPQGVDWGDGNRAYLAIGIAAKSDEHLGILKQLTHVLSAEGIDEQLKKATTADELIAILNGDSQATLIFDAEMIVTDFPAADLTQMSAVNAGFMKNRSAIDAQGVAALIAAQSHHLGHGVWLQASKEAKQTAIALVHTAHTSVYQNNPVSLLISIAAKDSAHLAVLNRLIELTENQQLGILVNSDANAIFTALTEEMKSGLSQVFTIHNHHGLHARPGAVLVATAKKYQSDIWVSNLDGDGKAVKAKSLMKVIALGVKHGHRLEFTADGPDAAEALAGIEAAIDAGLGEG